MTKHIRIENADMSEYKVRVQVFEKIHPAGDPDTLVSEEILGFPTAMTTTGVYLTSTRYVVVSELPTA